MLCFRKFPLAKKVKDRRGVIRSFHRQIFCLTMPKTSAGEPFCALCLRKIAVTKTIMDKRAGGIKIFRRFFCLRVPEHFVGENSCTVFQKVSLAKNSMDNRGG